MLELFARGSLVLYSIAVLSVIAVIIIAERLLYFRKISIDEEKIFSRLKTTLAKGHFDEALSICDSNPSPITNLMKVGIEYREYPQHVIRETITDAANMEIPQMEKFLAALGTITNIAPLLGLLGTVIGNINAFAKLGPELTREALAYDISEALVTTAAGIIVAVPSIIFYNYLVAKVNHIIIRLENKVNEMVLLLKGKAAKEEKI